MCMIHAVKCPAWEQSFLEASGLKQIFRLFFLEGQHLFKCDSALYHLEKYKMSMIRSNGTVIKTYQSWLV